MLHNLIDALNRVGKPTELYTSPDGSNILVLPYGGRVLGLFAPRSEENFFWTHPALASVESVRAAVIRSLWSCHPPEERGGESQPSLREGLRDSRKGNAAMDAIEALKARRSVRTYKGEPVPRKIIEDIVDCGRLAATAINIQPWEFVVVTDPGMPRRIANATDYGKFIADAPVCVLVLCRDTKYYLEDGSAATEDILLAARAHGFHDGGHSRQVCRTRKGQM